MKPLFSRFVLAITAICCVGYAYLASRVAVGIGARVLLLIPFVLVWSVPVVYWVYGRESHTRADELVHGAAYLCMGWLNFLLLLTLTRDALLLLAWEVRGPDALQHALDRVTVPLVYAGSLLALAVGALAALRGPHVREVDIPVAGLAPGLEGLRIVQISDLHAGPTIGRRYVDRVVRLANRLAPDLVALTGDIVDGPVPRLAPEVAPLAELQPRGGVFLVMGNHDYYAGGAAWIAHFRTLGLRVLLNEHVVIVRGGARLLLGGVIDPAARIADAALVPRADLAAGPGERADLRLLLAHNPALAPLAEQAGFDVQLSGHTHAGQFFPWTIAVRLVHAPHVAGLSRRGRLWVYVSAGTGTWGPPVRFGTEPELTLLRLVRAA